MASLLCGGAIAAVGDNLPTITLGEGVFQGCRDLTSINVTNSVRNILPQTFDLCTGLKSIVLSDRLESVSADALRDCRSLQTIECHATIPPEIETENAVIDSFEEAYITGATLHVPKGCKDAYQAAPGWKNFFNIVDDLELSGIDGIEADKADEPAEYFTLQGIRVENPEKGIYLRRQNGKTVKVYIR